MYVLLKHLATASTLLLSVCEVEIDIDDNSLSYGKGELMQS